MQQIPREFHDHSDRLKNSEDLGAGTMNGCLKNEWLSRLTARSPLASASEAPRQARTPRTPRALSPRPLRASRSRGTAPPRNAPRTRRMWSAWRAPPPPTAANGASCRIERSAASRASLAVERKNGAGEERARTAQERELAKGVDEQLRPETHGGAGHRGRGGERHFLNPRCLSHAETTAFDRAKVPVYRDSSTRRKSPLSEEARNFHLEGTLVFY